MTEQRPVVAVDFDDVIGGFNRAFYAWHNEHYGTNIAFHEIVSYDMPRLLGIDVAQLHRRVDRFVDECHHRILPLEGAFAGLNRLAKDFELHVVTNRCETLAPTTSDWLLRHKLDRFSELHFANGFNSRFPERRRRKLDVCRAIGAVALVEDADHHAAEVAAGGILVLMPVRPWNTGRGHPGIVRCGGWKQITTHLLNRT